MNILMVGADTKGSWTMRGQQLGEAIGARVTLAPRLCDWQWADVVVLVKRAAMAVRTPRLKVPVVWDALDFWAQPEDNAEPVEALTKRAGDIAAMAGVTLVIGATQAMADDLGGRYVRHHSRLGLTPLPPRPSASVVAYDGQQKYLGRWQPALHRACERLGLRFVVNPPYIQDADVLVSFRDGRWDGDVCRRWKSGVKQGNAIASGRPIVAQPCAAGEELSPVGVVVDRDEYLVDALAAATSRTMRDAAYERALNDARLFSLDVLAGEYLGLIRSAVSKVAA